MESENETVRLPQTSLGMHNLMIDLTVHLNQINPGLSWDVDPQNLIHMAENDPKLIKKIDDAYGVEEE